MRQAIHSRPTNHKLLPDGDWRVLADILQLSERELQLVQGVFDGFGETEISRALGISTHTVHTYFERLYRKLEVSSRCEMMVAVFAAHLSCGCTCRNEQSAT